MPGSGQVDKLLVNYASDGWRNIRFRTIARLALVMAALAGTMAGVAFGADETPLGASAPRIEPDYSGVTIPPNIAPLNFKILEPGSFFRVRLEADAGKPVELTSSRPIIQFPARAWSQLLAGNAGRSLRLDISTRGADAQWKRFQTITNRIAAETIDPVLIYRFIAVRNICLRT